MTKIGITERGDAAYDTRWRKWLFDGNPAVLITKCPTKLIDHLADIPNPNIIIHCNITGYGGSVIEPTRK